jgi:4-amino-4-deoxy-L-arabinose transferase-like glycosyltransferase
MALFARAHVDDGDADLYTVVVRHLVEDGTWHRLRFTSGVFPHFFEHPPLYFWVEALALKLGSEAVLPWLGVACGLGTLAVAFGFGRWLLGTPAAFLGVLTLVATESFVRYQGRALLDPPLVLLSTAAFAVLVRAPDRVSMNMLAGLVAGVGVLVKGPPALGAPLAGLLALALLGSLSPARWARTALIVGVSAAALPALLLLYDSAHGGGWWEGYVLHQVVDSFTGRRRDGVTSHAHVLKSLWGRFWPGLPFALYAMARAVRDAPSRRRVLALLAWAGLYVAAFSSTGRSSWYYVLPAYVPLALLAGQGAAELLQRLGARVEQGLLRGAVVFGYGGAVVAFLLPSSLVGPRQCEIAPIVEAAKAEPPGAPVYLVASQADLHLAGLVAGHTRRDVVLLAPSLLESGGGDLPSDAVVVVQGTQVPSSWRPLARRPAWEVWQALGRALPGISRAPPP